MQRFYNIQQRPRGAGNTALLQLPKSLSAIVGFPPLQTVWTGSMEETIATWDCLSSFPTPRREHFQSRTQTSCGSAGGLHESIEVCIVHLESLYASLLPSLIGVIEI